MLFAKLVFLNQFQALEPKTKLNFSITSCLFSTYDFILDKYHYFGIILKGHIFYGTFAFGTLRPALSTIPTTAVINLAIVGPI